VARQTKLETDAFRDGDHLAPMSIGPLLEDHSLRIARVARDFNPRYLVTEEAERVGESRVPLHPLWILTLACAALERQARGARVRSVRLQHLSHAFLKENLTFKGIVEETMTGSRAVGNTISVSFHVAAEIGRIIARGRAELTSDD